MKTASVRLESRDLASLETVMNIDEIRGLIFGIPKNATLLPKNMFQQKSGNTLLLFKIHTLSNNNIKVCNKTVTDLPINFEL